LREKVNKESSSTSIEKVDMDVDVENFGPISSPTKDSSLGRREIESVIFHIISTLHIVKSEKIFFNINPPPENTLSFCVG
jgi:hypothetical protein